MVELVSTQATYDKLLSEVPKYKLITQSVLSDRLRVCFSHVQNIFFASYLCPHHSISVVSQYTIVVHASLWLLTLLP